MKRFAPVLLVLAGWFIAQIAGTPQQVYAQARTSLSSLQSAVNALSSDINALSSTIDDIINGNTTVAVAVQAESVPVVGGGGNAATTPGELRFNAAEGTLQVSDGTAWLNLALENAP